MSNVRRNLSRDGSVSPRGSASARPLELVSASNPKVKRVRDSIRENFTVCTSGLGKHEKKHVRDVVIRLGGIFVDSVSGSCNYLICDSVGSEKYEKAVQHAVPVVSYEYIRKCDQEEKIVDFKEFQIHAFTGLTICCTGFDQACREEIERLVRKNGGRFDKGITEATTHLVVAPEGFNSEKHMYAKKMNLKSITHAWVDACVSLGAWCSEKEYVPKPPFPTLIKSDSSNGDVSSQLSDDAKTRADLAPIDALLRKPSVQDSSSRLRPDKTHIERDTMKAAFDGEGDLCNSALCGILCYVECPHDEERRQMLHAMALRMGAMVLFQFNPDLVTHIIVVPVEDSSENPQINIIKSLLEQAPSARVLTSDFLRACVDHNEWVTEESFRWVTRAPQLFKNKTICVSGYLGAERKAVERITKDLGGEFTDRLTPSVNYLICKGNTSEKYMKALEWKVPVHDFEWLRGESMGHIR